MALSKEAKREYDRQRYLNRKARRDLNKATNFQNVTSLIYYMFITHSYSPEIDFEKNYNSSTPLNYKGHSAEELYNNLQSGWSNGYIIVDSIIADFLKIDRRTVKSVITKLINQGYLIFIKSIVKKTNYVKVYQLNIKGLENTDYILPIFAEKIKNFRIYLRNLNEKSSNQKRSAKFLRMNMWINEYRNSFQHFLEVQENGTILYHRNYNELCITPNPYNHEDRPLTRFSGLDYEYNLPNLNSIEEYEERYNEYDVNGMHLRLLINFKNLYEGKDLVSNNIDVYELIWNEFKYEYLDKLVNPIDNFHDSEFREILKFEVNRFLQKQQATFMRRRDYTFFAHTKEANDIIEKVNTNQANDKEIRTAELLQDGYDLEKLFNGITYGKFLTDLTNALYKLLRIDGTLKYIYFGVNYYNIEGSIYAVMYKYAKSKGIQLYNVYDCWFGLKNEYTEEFFFEVYEYAVNKVYELLGTTQIEQNIKSHQYGDLEYDELTDTYIVIDKEQTYKELLHDVKTLGENVYNKFIEFAEPKKSQITDKVAQEWFTQLVQLSSTDRILSIQQSIEHEWFNFYPPKNISRHDNFNFNNNKTNIIQMTEVEKQVAFERRVKEGKRIIY